MAKTKIQDSKNTVDEVSTSSTVEEQHNKIDKYILLRSYLENAKQTTQQSFLKIKLMILEKQQEIIQKEKELDDLKIALNKIDGAQQLANKILSMPI